MRISEEFLAATFSPVIMMVSNAPIFPNFRFSTYLAAGEIHFQVRNGFGSNLSAMVADLFLVRD